MTGAAKIMELAEERARHVERIGEIDSEIVGIRATYYASVLKRNQELERRLTWVMENTPAGHHREAAFGVHWISENLDEVLSTGSSYEDAIDKAMALDAATER